MYCLRGERKIGFHPGSCTDKRQNSATVVGRVRMLRKCYLWGRGAKHYKMQGPPSLPSVGDSSSMQLRSWEASCRCLQQPSKGRATSDWLTQCWPSPLRAGRRPGLPISRCRYYWPQPLLFLYLQSLISHQQLCDIHKSKAHEYNLWKEGTTINQIKQTTKSTPREIIMLIIIDRDSDITMINMLSNIRPRVRKHIWTMGNCSREIETFIKS